MAAIDEAVVAEIAAACVDADVHHVAALIPPAVRRTHPHLPTQTLPPTPRPRQPSESFGVRFASAL